MKASEVLARYAKDERNFQRVNLRGQSFEDKNLAGADFSEADLRSTNFTGANLRGANFTGAKCGLQKRWAIVLIILSCLMTAISGLFSIVTGFVVSLTFDSDLQNQIADWVCLLVLAIFLIVTIRQEIGAGAVTAGVLAAAVLAAAVVALAAAVVGRAAERAAALAALAVGVLAAALAAGALAAGVLAGVLAVAALAALAAGVYVGWRAMKGDPRDAWIRSFVIAFAAIGGTSFRSADLTDANFSSAKLKSTDMRDATLTRVRWYGTSMLDRVRPGDTYLQGTQVRQWLIGKGVDNNFDGQKMQGVNFQGADLTNASFIDANLSEANLSEANLQDASFIDANLSKANLQDADLSRAKLVQTQLDKTDFTRATLTGAYIEGWGITSNTVLHEVKCQYVYTRLPTEKNPEPCRKPDNRSEMFEDGDFADFIKPIFDTLDLYHNQGVDPRAIAISWKELAENNPDAKLQFALMEVKGSDNLLLRLKTSPNTDLSQLSADYFATYNQIKALAEPEYKKLMAAKDNRIQALENMVNTALKRPGFYAENYNHQGDNEMTGEQRKIDLKEGNYNEQIEDDYVQGNKTDQSRNLNNSGTINNSGAGAFGLGDINGTVANTINQLPPSSNSDEPGIKELLTQLQAAVADPQLSDDDRQPVLEQIQILAEAGQNPQDATMQKKAERAVGFLEVIAKGVEPASKLAKACAKVLPKILAFFV